MQTFAICVVFMAILAVAFIALKSANELGKTE